MTQGRIFIHDDLSPGKDPPDQTDRGTVENDQIDLVTAKNIGKQAEQLQFGFSHGFTVPEINGDIDIRKRALLSARQTTEQVAENHIVLPDEDGGQQSETALDIVRQ